jgi:catechol 2,3-dioxygenase-like lactoylglutathione lyase family enzyme
MHLDHILLTANDVSAMRDFLVGVLGLDDGFRPPFSFPGHWLYSDARPFIHLAPRSQNEGQSAYLGANRPSGTGGPVDHIALAGGDLAIMRSQLTGKQVRFAERRVPESGEIQIFIEGPEGLRIELLFPPVRQSAPAHRPIQQGEFA